MTGRLAGWRVLVTRQPEQARGLADALAAAGATVVEVPLIETVPPEDTGPLDAAVARLAAFDWIAFTSANAVRAVEAACRRTGAPATLPPGVASVGSATTAEIARLFPHASVPLQPTADFRAEGLADAFRSQAVRGRSVFLPLSSKARDTLARELQRQGAVVSAVTAYRTVTRSDAAPRIRAALSAGIDVVAFASPSAVESFAEACPDPSAWPRAVVIGPVTESAASGRGFDVAGVAAEASAEGLADAIARLTRPR